MKNIQVIEAFAGRQTAKSTNLWTTGSHIVNYSTTLAQYGDGEIIVNMTKYSTSTSTIQNKLLAHLIYEYGKNYVRVVTGIERATKELN